MTHDEIVEFIREEIERLSLIAQSYPQRKKSHVEPAYEDGEFTGESILPLLDRWGDRKVSA